MTNSRTVLHSWHIAHKARMVPFGGWEMPVQYSSIQNEHRAVRTSAGLFDISHMGRLTLTGADSLDFIQHIWTNDAAALKPGQVRYGLLCNQAGGILDDILVYRLDASQTNWLLVVNASNRPKLLPWFQAHAQGRDVQLTDRTDEWAMLAVQGPNAIATQPEAGMLKYYSVMTLPNGRIISRTGYTGEDGYEIILPAGEAAAHADTLLAAGVVPCGLGARDTLRLEAAMPLYGHELTEEIDPLQAGLAWAVKLTKPDFVGKASILARQADLSRNVRVGLELEGRRIARETSPVVVDGRQVGVVTSGTLSPTLEKSIAMAYIEPQLAAPNTAVSIDIRGSLEPARVVTLPFYTRPKSS